MKQINGIRRFPDAFGPNGLKDAAVAYAQEEACETCTCEEGHMYNLCMNLKGNSQGGVSITLDAYSGKVGPTVQAAKSNGLLRLLSLGGWDVKNITANKVPVKSGDGKLIPGIVCSKPVCFMDTSEQGKALGLVDVLIDIGVTSAQEVQGSFRISIGVPIVPDVTCTYDGEHQIFMGKTSDSRTGCIAVVETLCRLHRRTLTNTVSATLSSQEKAGEHGMTCVVNSVKLDVVVRFEGCLADDNFEEEYMIRSALKKGPMLRHFDRSMITSPRFQRFALELVRANDVPVQENVREGGGTNDGITHTARFGIPTIIAGMPVCYAHSSYGILAYQNYEYAIELAIRIVEGPSKDIAENF